MKFHIIEMNRFVWRKIIRMVLKIRYFFHILEPSSLIIYARFMGKSHILSIFLAVYDKFEVKITWYRRFWNLLGKYQFWISIIDLSIGSKNVRIWSKKVAFASISSTRISYDFPFHTVIICAKSLFKKKRF